MDVRTKLIGTIVVGAALVAPAVHAQRPDDRADARGPGAIAAQGTFANGVPGGGYTAPEANGVVVRGDDKRDIGARRTSGVLVGDDKQNLPTGEWAYRFWQTLPQDLDREPIEAVSTSHGFDWGDAGIGAAAAFGLVLIAAGATAVGRRQRRAAALS